MLSETFEKFLFGRMNNSKLVELGLSRKGNRKIEFWEYTPDWEYSYTQYYDVEIPCWEIFMIIVSPAGFVIDEQRIG